MLLRILERLLSKREFLSPYGVRSVSRIHAEERDLGVVPGIGRALIEYVPGESTSGLFGGNSNWRGPIWMAINCSLVQAIEKFHRFLGDDFKLPGVSRVGGSNTGPPADRWPGNVDSDHQCRPVGLGEKRRVPSSVISRTPTSNVK